MLGFYAYQCVALSSQNHGLAMRLDAKQVFQDSCERSFDAVALAGSSESNRLTRPSKLLVAAGVSEPR